MKPTNFSVAVADLDDVVGSWNFSEIFFVSSGFDYRSNLFRIVKKNIFHSSLMYSIHLKSNICLIWLKFRHLVLSLFLLQIVHKCKRHVKIKPKQNKILQKKKTKNLTRKTLFFNWGWGKNRKTFTFQNINQTSEESTHSLVRSFVHTFSS